MGDPSEEYTLKADVEVEDAETTGFSTHCLRGNLESFGIFWLKQKSPKHEEIRRGEVEASNKDWEIEP